MKWNEKKIDEYTKTCKKIFTYSVDYKYLSKHFEEIYITCLKEGVLIPDLCENIYYLTDDGKKAIDKIEKPSIDTKTINILVESIDKRDRLLYDAGENIKIKNQILSQELIDFIEIYPQWKNLVTYEIKWNYDEINKLTNSSKKENSNYVDYNYLSEHFIEIYLKTLNESVLLPELFEYIEYCTKDNNNALETILLPEVSDTVKDSLAKQRMDRTLKLISLNEKEVSDFLIDEVKTFINKYPQWTSVLITV